MLGMLVFFVALSGGVLACAAGVVVAERRRHRQSRHYRRNLHRDVTALQAPPRYGTVALTVQ